MPNIREYQATQSPAGPGAVQNIPLSIAGAKAAGGRALGSALSDVAGEIYATGERIDRSKVQMNTAQARADLTIEMQEAIKSGDAATPDFTKRWDDRMAARLAQDQKGYHTGAGSQLAAESSAALTSEFRVQANHYQAVAVGQQAALGLKIALETNEQTLVDDPMQFQSVLDASISALHDPNGAYARDLPAQKVAELDLEMRQRLAVAAVRGVILTAGPELADEMMDNGTGPAQYLSADQQKQLRGESRTAFLGREADQARIVAKQKEDRRISEEVVESEFVDLFQAKNLTAKQIQKADISSDKKLAWLGRIKIGAASADPTTVNALFRRIHLPEGDPNKITTEEQLYRYFGNGVDHPSLNALRSELKHDPFGVVMNSAQDTARTMLTRSLEGALEPGKSAEALHRWRLTFNAAWQKKIQDKENPMDLITPGHKDNLLERGQVMSYLRSNKEASTEAYAAKKAGFEAAQAEFGKPKFGNLPNIQTVAEAQALQPGTYFVIVAPGRPPELRIR